MKTLLIVYHTGGVKTARMAEAVERGARGEENVKVVVKRCAEAGADDVIPIQMEGDCPVVVREKFHAATPMSIDQALLEMELVGHDFYLFHDSECDRFSVVYRRRGYDYGVIRLVEEGRVATLCVHGDEPEAVANADLIRRILDRDGIAIRCFLN